MAGEIQVNSVTALTESGSNIVLNNVDTATNRTNLGLGSMATQDANAVALTGGSLTGTEIDLKSSGTTIYKSDGTTAVLSESGGVVTLNNGTIGSGVVFPAGHIINFKSSSHSTATTITSTTNGSGTSTGLSVGITPSSTSNLLLILVNIQFRFDGTGGAGFEIYDGTSVIYNDASRDANYIGTTSNGSKRRNSLQTVINPSSSGSEITYTVRAFKISGTFVCQDSTNPSTISIFEIKQ